MKFLDNRKNNRKKDKEKTRRKIERFLEENKGVMMSKPDMAKKVGISYKTLCDHLKEINKEE